MFRAFGFNIRKYNNIAARTIGIMGSHTLTLCGIFSSLSFSDTTRALIRPYVHADGKIKLAGP